jgi:alpha-tubulin suppressor-like RCC1 family protein
MDQRSPVRSGLAMVSGAACGGSHSCALTATGVACVGDGARGQLGHGMSAPSRTPVAVALGFMPTELALGEAHGCAASASQGPRCWGANDRGQLGDGTTMDRNAPVAVLDVPGASSLALGAAFGCAVNDTGLRCWGANDHGQLGDGSTTDRPRPVATLARVLSLAAGDAHVCALINDMTPVCAGDNREGQLGTGDRMDRPRHAMTLGFPRTILTGVLAGGSASCAIMAGGTLWCWGRNADGELGDGTTTARELPVLVWR